MKIDPQNASGITSSQAASLSSAANQRASAATGATGDQAELSGLSKAIQTFRSDRAARVDKLTALVRSGKYDVSPSLISGSIVSEALNASAQPVGAVSR